MNINLILGICILVYLFLMIASPFPNWRIWLVITRHVLFDWKTPIPFRARLRQLRYLMRYPLLAPLWCLLWYADELLFPGYRKTPIEKPIFITGQPRCGSTFIHRTLAADEEHFYALRHLEWRYPFILVHKIFEKLGLTERLHRKSFWPDTSVGRVAREMHKNLLGDYEEDSVFFEEQFLVQYFVLFRFPYFGLAPHLEYFTDFSERKQKKMMKRHWQTIRKFGYLRGNGRRFISKEVVGLDMVALMPKYFPDATIITTSRQPREFVNSLVKLVTFSAAARIGLQSEDLAFWADFHVEKRRRDCRLFLDLFTGPTAPQNTIALAYKQLNAHVEQVMKNVYIQLGLTMTDTYAHYLVNLQASQDKRRMSYKVDYRDLDGFDKYEAYVSERETIWQALLVGADQAFNDDAMMADPQQ